ncbi:30682_t:CDS:2 [Gigaspora margarita]|uniref:30682_t:CDS:1 n=1 Tax=Gigaspora margarita TaxID=4874 RepID=A0ABN7VSU3_GIGMA|nr:30682_t:CDS:2 [Gigaspora margarita]
MLALCLGHKVANSNNFCLWCECQKELNDNFDYNWTISKNMNDINQNFIKKDDHIKKLLFPMFASIIGLIISKLKTTKQYDLKRKAIIDKMNQININFKFWQEDGSSNWKYTSLIGNNKLKMVREFDLTQIFPEN